MEKEPRKYASEIEKRRKPLKDVEADSVTRLFSALVWLVPVGFIVSGFVGFLLLNRGWNPLLALLTAFGMGLGGALLVYGLLYVGVIGGTASLFGRLYFSSSPAPPKPTSWRGQALAAHGSLGEALKAYEEEAARYLDDPGPCLRAATLCLDELDDPEGAVAWYERARRAADLTPETDQYICMRLADLHETLDAAAPAMVELRRLLERHPDSQYAPGARARLASIKARQAEAHEAEQES